MRSTPSRHAMVFSLALTLAVAGCASSGSSGSRPDGATANRIVRAELEPLGQIDGLQAVNRLRPRWTAVRGGPGASEPVLYIDGTRRSNLRDLAALRTTDIEQMEYLSSSDATTRYGTGHTGGAIMVTMRR